MEALFARICFEDKRPSAAKADVAKKSEPTEADREREAIRREYQRLARNLVNTREGADLPLDLRKKS
jgi:hypothetical protein